MQASPSAPLSERFRLPALPRWAWTLLGGAIGLFDFGVLVLLDADMRIGEMDATWIVALAFLVPYAILGWAVGGLAAARARADRDAETIRSQLRALERTQRALVQEEKLAGIGRLAAGVAHEVRNPLGVIRASASMARESFDEGTDPHRALGFVCEETDRLDRLIASLLTFARPQPVERVEVDVTKVIDRAMELARSEARAHGVTLEIEVEPGLPTVRVDPDRLARSVYGLTLNAIQALAEDDATPRRIRIHARGRMGAGGHLSACGRMEGVALRVEDSGPGVSPELRDSIFEPFVTSKETGTGLGLPMALRMVEAQGGHLTLLDAPSALGGAAFSIELPSAAAEASP